MKLITKLALAACIAVVAVLLFWNPGSRSSLAFAEVIEQVKQAKSVRFKATSTIELPNQPKRTIESTMTIVGNTMRQEMPDMVTLMDFEKGVMLSLQPKTKQATRITMENVPANLKAMNLMEQFKSMKPELAQDLGEKELNGRKLRGFTVVQPGQKMTVWADPKTQEPVQIESSFDMPSIPATSSIMRDFDWNATIDLAELSLEAPQGYTVQSVKMDASQPIEKDLVEGLRTMARLNGDQFPPSFDLPGLTTAVTKHVISRKNKGDQTSLEAELMPLMLTVSRGIAFVSPASGSEFYYAGAGAKLGEKDRAVLWYQPKDSTSYRVIDAELKVADVSPDALPKISARKLIPGASPFIAPPAAATRPASQPAAP